MKLLGKNIAVSVPNQTGSKTTAGGLFLAGSSDDSQILKGKIVGVGPEVHNLIRSDEIVYFSKFNSSKITTTDGDFYVLDIGYVLMVE